MKAAPARALAAVLAAALVVSACSGTGGQAASGRGGAEAGQGRRGRPSPPRPPTAGPPPTLPPPWSRPPGGPGDLRRPGRGRGPVGDRREPQTGDHGVAPVGAGRADHKRLCRPDGRPRGPEGHPLRDDGGGPVPHKRLPHRLLRGQGRAAWCGGRASSKGHVQPACTLASATNMVACDNWAPSMSLVIGRQFVQGDYLFKLVADPGAPELCPAHGLGPVQPRHLCGPEQRAHLAGLEHLGRLRHVRGRPARGHAPVRRPGRWWSRSTGPMPTAAGPPISWPWSTRSSTGPKSTGSTSPTGPTSLFPSTPVC